MDAEIWEDIKGYEGLYQVSSLGNIRSLSKQIGGSRGNTVTRKEKLKKTVLQSNGYKNVILHKNKISTGFGVHRLVAAAFIANPHNLPVVNHKNFNKSDNRIENLEWCTQSQNVLHSNSRLGKDTTGIKYDKKRGKFVAWVYRNNKGHFVGRYETLEEAKKYRDDFRIHLGNILSTENIPSHEILTSKTL